LNDIILMTLNDPELRFEGISEMTKDRYSYNRRRIGTRTAMRSVELCHCQ